MKYLRVAQNRAGSNDPQGYTALRDGVAVVDRSERRIFRLTGKDPIGMLNAVLTNDVPAEDNLGAYAMLLDPKGKVQTDLRVVKAADELLVDTEPEGAEATREILGRYAPFSRVKLEELPDWTVLGLYGPRARGLLENLDLAEHETKRTEIGDASVIAVGVALPVGGYDLVGSEGSMAMIHEYLLQGGATLAGHDAYETARIAAGIPRFGSDTTPDNFPGESENVLERAVSFEKGCYPGQETVARMHYRGSPNKTLRRLAIYGPSPVPGTEISQGERKVGYLTSIGPLPVNGETLALGYLSRSADPKSVLRAGEARLGLLA